MFRTTSGPGQTRPVTRPRGTAAVLVFSLLLFGQAAVTSAPQAWAGTGQGPPPGEAFETDFSGDQVGERPAGWSSVWREGDWQVLDEPRRLQLDIPSAGSRRGLSPDAFGDNGVVEGGVEVSTMVRGESTSAFLFYVGLHLSGEAGSENGYVLYARPPHAANANQLSIARYQGGTFTTLASTTMDFDLDADTWFRMRFVRDGSTLRGKLWRDGVDDEPADWQVSVEDFAFDSGRVGVLHFASGTVNEWAEFSAVSGDGPSVRED